MISNKALLGNEQEHLKVIYSCMESQSFYWNFSGIFFLFSFEHIASFMSVAFTAPTKFLLNRPIDSNNFLQKVSIIEMSSKNFHEIAG